MNLAACILKSKTITNDPCPVRSLRLLAARSSWRVWVSDLGAEERTKHGINRGLAGPRIAVVETDQPNNTEENRGSVNDY